MTDGYRLNLIYLLLVTATVLAAGLNRNSGQEWASVERSTARTD
jgi:hypothetical protein